MLDTNILTYLLRNKPASVASRINALADADTMCMSFITYTELLKGAERSTRKADVMRRLDGLVRQVPVHYPGGRSIRDHYAVQFMRLKDAGTPIGGTDLWIACHALGEEATLVTNNLGEFSRVQGLRIENWAE